MIFFYLKRIVKKWPVWLLIILPIALSVGLFYQNVQKSNQAMTKVVSTTQKQVKKVGKEVAAKRQKVADLPEAKQADEQLALEDLESRLADLEAKEVALKSGKSAYLDWFLNQDLPKYLAGPVLQIENGTVPTSVFQKTLSQYQQIKAQQIEPMYPLVYLSDFEEIGALSPEAVQIWKKENPQYFEKAWYHLWQSISQGYVLIILAIVCLLVCGLLAEELQKKRRHLSFYLVEKISVARVFLTNFVTRIICGLLVSLVIVAGILLICGLINGFGSLAYPVPVNILGSDTATFLPLQDYFINCLILYFLCLVLASAVAMLVEAVVSQFFVALVVESFILVAGIFMTPLTPINPFSYFHIDQVLRLGFPDMVSFSLPQACGSLLISASLCLVLAFLIMRSKVGKVKLGNWRVKSVA